MNRHAKLPYTTFYVIVWAFVFAGAFRSGGAQPGTALWSFVAPYQIGSSPALAHDGTIYLGTVSALYAITNAGSNAWCFPVGVSASPAVGADGTIHFGGTNCTLYALLPDGSLRWSYSIQSEFQFNVTLLSSPAIGLDSSVYVIAAARVYAFSPNGAKQWDHVIDDLPGSGLPHPVSPAIGPDGTIYAVSLRRGALYALNTDGSEKWHSAIDNGAGESAAVGGNGTVYVTGQGLYALSPNGVPLWQINGGACCSPVVAKDGTIYIPNPNNLSLSSVKPTGSVNWNRLPAGPFYPPPPTTPAITDSGLVYYANSNSVFAVSPQGVVQWIFAVPYDTGGPIPGCFSSPAIGPDGTVYAGFVNTLYAIAGTNILADSTWPMYRQNPRHTGKVEKPSLQRPQKRSDANFQFQLYGQLGDTNSVQASIDLFTWTSLTDIVITNVPMDFIDFTASNFASRFYRTVSP